MEMHGNQTLLWTAHRQRCMPMEIPLHLFPPVDVLQGIEIPMESAREHKFPWIAVSNGAVAIRMPGQHLLYSIREMMRQVGGVSRQLRKAGPSRWPSIRTHHRQ